MALNQFYPATRYQAPPLLDLSDQSERERLSSGAARAFFNLMECWKIGSSDARRLLGGMSNGSFFELKKKPGRVLGEDQLRRISYLLGIFEALNVLYDEELADRWVHLANNNAIFGGMAPVEYLIRGGLPAFDTVQRLLDARQVGH